MTRPTSATMLLVGALTFIHAMHVICSDNFLMFDFRCRFNYSEQRKSLPRRRVRLQSVEGSNLDWLILALLRLRTGGKVLRSLRHFLRGERRATSPSIAFL